MRPDRPIFWHQGLFLQPQHFQLQDCYFQSLLHPFLRFPPHFWGVSRLEIRKEALANGLLEVEAGEFLFPDGTWAVYPGNALMGARTIDKDLVLQERSVKTFVGIRKADPAAASTAVLDRLDDLSGVASRFICHADPEEVPDLYQQGPPAQVQRMFHLLKIFWETELEGLSQYSLIPLARLELEGGEVCISRHFTPPALAISASALLSGILQEIRDQVTTRCRQLEEYKRPQEIMEAGFESRYLIHLLALRSLNRFVPSLTHIAETPGIHPWPVYGLLRELIGELSTFSGRVNALGEIQGGAKLLPPYDHQDLGACFGQAQILIAELLDELRVGPKFIIHLNREQDSFTAQIPPEAFENLNDFYLVLKTDHPEGVPEAIRQMAKLSSMEGMATLLARALPGCPMRYQALPPPGLPRRANTFCFHVERENALWREIQRSRNLCLYWHKAPEDADGEIIVVRRSGA